MNVNEYNNLLNKYIKLLFEKNKLIMRDAPYIESRYLFHFGDLMVEELKHNKYIKELRIKQNIYENYFGLKREKEIKNIQHEIKKQTGILSKQICVYLKGLKMKKINFQNRVQGNLPHCGITW